MINYFLILIAFLFGAIIGVWHGYLSGYESGAMSFMGKAISFFHKKGMDHFETIDTLEEIGKEESYFNSEVQANN